MHESRMVSAYHNYVVEGRLQDEFVLNSPDSGGLLLWGHRVKPGCTVPLLSGNIYNAKGRLLAVIDRNILSSERPGLSLCFDPCGLTLQDEDGTTLLRADIESFANGYATRIRGLLYGVEGSLAAWGDDLGLHIAEPAEPTAAVNQSA
jgi:hypothetical protein